MNNTALAAVVAVSVGLTGCYVEIEGGKVWYESHNISSDGSCEIFVHGNSAPSNWMQKAIEIRKNKGICTVVLDLPGHGKSDRFTDYTLPNMISAITAVINKLELESRESGYNVISWSYGGDIVMHAMNNDMLTGMKSLTLISTAPLNLTGRELPNPSRLDSFVSDTVIKNAYHLNPELNDSQLRELTQSFVCHNDTIASDCSIPEDLFESVRLTDGAIRSGIVESFGQELVKDEIDILKNRLENVKLCMIYGQADAYINPDYMSAVFDLVSRQGDKIYRFETGHAVMYEQPKKFSDTLDECYSE